MAETTGSNSKRSRRPRTRTSTTKTVSAKRTISRTGVKTKSSTAIQSTAEQEFQAARSAAKKKQVIKIVKWTLETVFLSVLILGVIASIDFMIQYYENRMTAAVVNAEKISQASYTDRLDMDAGSIIINRMIDETLITQEAEAQGVTVSTEEIDDQVAQAEAYYGDKAKFLQDLGMTEEEFRRRIEISLLQEKLIKKEVTITDEQALQYFETNKDYFKTGDTEPVFEDVKADIIDMLTEQEVQNKAETWKQQLRDKSSIQNNVDGKVSVNGKEEDYDTGFILFRKTKELVHKILDKVKN